jgi:hypothetical protein
LAYDASREDRFTRDPAAGGRAAGSGQNRERNKGWYWLFVLPLVFTLLPMIYNSGTPELIGIPFFYWYQMAWVPITVALMVIAYRKTTYRKTKGS